MPPRFKETDEDTIATIVGRYKDQDTWKGDTVFEKDSFELLENILEEAGELNERVPYEKLVSTQFSEKAAKQILLLSSPEQRESNIENELVKIIYTNEYSEMSEKDLNNVNWEEASFERDDLIIRKAIGNEDISGDHNVQAELITNINNHKAGNMEKPILPAFTMQNNTYAHDNACH